MVILQAVARAKQELLPLIVYLHADDHQDTREFCRCGLCDTDIVGKAAAVTLSIERCVAVWWFTL